MFITVILWGLSWPIGRLMVSDNYGATIPPFMIASIRYVLVVLLFLPITYLKDSTLNYKFFKSHWKEILPMAILSVTIYQFGYLYGEKYTAAGDAALVIGIAPISIMIISYFVIHETLTKPKIIGAVLAFLGVFISVFAFSPNIQIPLNDRLFGDGLVFIAAFAYASYTVLLRRLFNKFGPNDEKPSSFQVILWVSIVGLIITYPLSLFLYPSYLDVSLYFIIPERIWLGIIYLATLSTVVAYVAFLESVKIIGAGRSAIFVNLVPVVGVVSSVFIGEIFDPIIHTTAFILIFIGITLVNRTNNNLIKDEKISTSEPNISSTD